MTRSSTRRSPSPHSPSSRASTSASPSRSTGQQEWAQGLAPRPDPPPQQEVLAAIDPTEQASRATPTGTTPRPASYPTPTTFRPDFLSTRSLSHAAHQRSEAGTRWDADAWRTSMVERSFGQVLTDVFRVPSVSDFAGKRSPRQHSHAPVRAAVISTDEESLPVEMPMSTPGDEPSFAPSRKHSFSPQDSPTLSRNRALLAAPSPAGTPDARGPQVNVMEPTPAPSRVGSLGDTKILEMSGPAVSASSPDATSSETIAPQDQVLADIAEVDNPVKDPSRLPPAPGSVSGGHRAGLAGKLAPGRASPKSRSPVRKKEKKGMFFIQSPSHATRDGMRQGSASGSEGSASIGSNSLSPMVYARQTASPLSAAELPEPAAPDLPAEAITSQPTVAPDSAAVAQSRGPTLAKSPTNTTSKRRSSSTLHKPPPMGHRRSSGERPARTSHTAGPAQQPHLAPPRRTASAASMAGKFQGEKARAAEVINARLQRQRQAEKERQAEARDKAALYKRQQSEPDLAHAQTREVYGEPIIDDTPGDDDEWSSETEETSPVKDGQGLRDSGKHRSQGGHPGMDLARAADEARRQRELFAKRAIYGSQTDLTAVGLGQQPPARPGLLSNLFETQRDVIRRNASMVDLVSLLRFVLYHRYRGLKFIL